ncbi:MAG: FimV/HubP family polar landmark protein [Gammaproteobacteria bacterium]
MRRLLLLGLALFSASPVCVYALSLGNLELKSGLHQPLDARIPILSATSDEIETLHVGVAPAAEFNRAGVNYAGILTQLKFDIQQTRKGPDYIRITSHDPVNEPFLNFLVEANWAKGRLIREFTALLDPPLYDPSRRVAWEPAKIKSGSPATPATTQPAPASTASGRELVAKTPTPVPAPVAKEKPAANPSPAPTQTAESAPAPMPSASGAYPTLWSAAASMRPNRSVSMQQMMVALLRTNPEAFIRGNMNLLKKGYVLKMPEQSELTATSRAEALAEFQRHDALWREYRERGAQAAPHQPQGATSVASAAEPATNSASSETKPEAPAATDESKLKLLAGNDATGKSAAANAGDLALTKEALESKNRENEELKSQLKESEDIIDKLKSRVSLQDSQLAELQQKLGAGATTAAPAAEETAPSTAEATAPATAETAAAAPAATAPAAGAPEPWRSLDNQVQTPTYPLPNSSSETPPASAETTPPAETPPTAPAATEQTPPTEGTAQPTTPPPEATAEAPPAEAPTIETPPAAAPPPEQEASTEPNKAAEQPPAAAGSTETTAQEPAPATPETPPAPAAAAEAPEQAPAAEQPAPAAGVVEKINGLLSKFIPTSILDSVPGGGLTLLGGLLALLGGLSALVMRRRAVPVADSFPTVADDEPISSFDSALSGATSAAEAPAMDDEDLFGVPDDSNVIDTLDRAEPPAFDRTTVQAPTTPALREDAEEDPLAEVNVYLAYERFDEAERLIREAIANHPNEHKYKLRLLEVYYSSNNRQAYESAARELHDAVGGTGPLWDSALAMWREMSPNRDLFSAGGDLASTLGEGGQRQFVDITALGEEAISRTVTSAVVPGISTLGDSGTATTNSQLTGDAAAIFDPGAATDQAFDMLDITAAGDVKQSDTDILDLSANPASSIGEDSSMVAGASEAVNELLSLTKSGSVVAADAGASLMESSLDFDAGFMNDQPGSASSTMSPSDLLDFDLGAGDATEAKSSDNIVDFLRVLKLQIQPNR